MVSKSINKKIRAKKNVHKLNLAAVHFVDAFARAGNVPCVCLVNVRICLR